MTDTDTPPVNLPDEAPDDLVLAVVALSDGEAAATVQGLAGHPGPATVPALRRLAASARPAVAMAAIAALGSIRTGDAATALAALDEELVDKERRKLTRRMLHHLTAAGIRPEMRRTPAARLPDWRSEYQPYRGLASHIDGQGTRLVNVALAEPAGGVVVLTSVVNDTEGITHFSEQRRGRRRFDEETRAVLAGEWPIYVELPAEYARFLLYEAIALAERERRSLPVEVLPWHDLIVAGQPAVERALVYEHVDLSEVRWNPSYLEASPELLRLREFYGWGPDPAKVAAFSPAADAGQARIVLPGETQEARAATAAARAVAAVFDGASRQRLRRRLEEMAYLLLRRGQERDARRALAAALALETPASDPRRLLGAPAAEHPLLLAMVEHAFSALREEREGVVRDSGLWLPSATE